MLITQMRNRSPGARYPRIRSRYLVCPSDGSASKDVLLHRSTDVPIGSLCIGGAVEGALSHPTAERFRI